MSRNTTDSIRIAITSGDPNGIGPEVALRAASSFESDPQVEIVLVGSETVFRRHTKCLPDQFPRAEIVESGSIAFETRFGEVSGAAGRFAMAAVEHAVDACLKGDVDAMVTAPISKEAIASAGFDGTGHTEFIGRMCGVMQPVMVMTSARLRVALVTVHVPLRDVAALISTSRVRQVIDVFSRSLRGDFGVHHPTFAVLGLNPHAGDGGVLGNEELAEIAPAIVASNDEHLTVEGPFSADGFFGRRLHESYDGVVAMYHDQGLVPFKTLTFGHGVNYSAGLPIVRTSPDHGTAFEIAGKGIADSSSTVEAVRLAAEIVVARRADSAVSADSQQL